MFSKLRTAALSAVIGLGAIAAMPAAAQADGLYLNFGGSHHGAGVGIHVGGRDGAHYRRDYRYDRRDTGPARRTAQSTRPSAWAFAAPASSTSCRHSIKVAGRKHGDRVRMTFGRAPHCPIVRW